MDRKALLLERLEEIGRSLAESGRGLALLGLGSVGLETGRLDEHSDLDFFAIVEPGSKALFLREDLDWLERVRPLVYRFRNTRDGFKVLFDDGVFAEFAVFEPAELPGIPFARGRIVWKQPHVDDSIAIPVFAGTPHEPAGTDWLVGEALTNLYVGLGRFRRGEKLAAARLIQGHAVDRILDLAPLVEPETPSHRDPFSGERRFEQRFPNVAAELPRFNQGYERSPESALAILEFLERHFEVNPAMATAIRDLVEPG
jgi:hypothetical protein